MNLNATIQALRNVTFMLQAEKHGISSFDKWYPSWQQRMRGDNVLRWLVDARNQVVKQGDLQTDSIARVHVTFTWNGAQRVTDFSVPPSTTIESIIGSLRVQVAPEIQETGVLTVERRWVASSLSDWELLDALAYCYGLLATLIDDAHVQCRQPIVGADRAGGKESVRDAAHLGGRLPCMVATAAMRSVDINLRTGAILTDDEHWVPYDSAAGKEAAARYGLEPGDLTRGRGGPFEWAEFCVDLSKRALARDGYHWFMVFLFVGNEVTAQFVLGPEDQQDKYLLMQKVADEAERTGADGAVTIGEAWAVQAEDLGPGLRLRPAEVPTRREALVVTVATADGRSRSYDTLFNRVDSRVEFEDTVVAEADTMWLMEPIHRVWRRRNQPTPPMQ